MSENLTFGQRRSIAFNRAFGRQKMLIALCCLLAFLTAALSFDPLRVIVPVLGWIGYAVQVFLAYDVHRTTLLDAGARRRPSLADAIKFALLSAAIFAAAFGMIYLLQMALGLDEPAMPGSGAFWLTFITSFGPILFIYLVIFPIIALCFPSLAYDGRLRLAENVRAGLRIWLRVLGRIIMAVLPWVILTFILMMAVQVMLMPTLGQMFTALAAGQFTPGLIVMGIISAVLTVPGIAILIAVAVTLSETFRDEGSLHEQT